MRANMWLSLLMLGILLAVCGSAAAQAIPEAVIFVPKTGTPLAAPINIPLPSPLDKDRTVAAEIVPGSLTDMPVTCPLAVTTTVAGAATGTNAVAVTLAAPSVPCGGGHHRLTLRVTAQPTGQQAGDAPALLVQEDVSLWIRFEPGLDVTPANTQTAELRVVGCWTCLTGMRPVVTSFLTPEVWTKSQSYVVKNTSIGSVSLHSEIVPTGSSPVSAAHAVTLSGGASGDLLPGATATVTVESAAQKELDAGTYDLGLMLTGTEAGSPPRPIQESTTVPIRLSLRYGVSWALGALVIGLLVGRGIALIQDPAYASKLEFFDRIRAVRSRARADHAADIVFQQLDTLERRLDSIYGAVPDAMKTELTNIENSLDPGLAAARAGAPAAARPSLARSGGWLVGQATWLLTGTQPPTKLGADVIRPSVQLVIVLVGLFTGLRANYVNVATFGANGILDLLPAVIWSAATVAVAKTLDAFAKS